MRRSPQGRVRSEPSVAGAVARFALAGLVAFAVVGVVSFLILRNVGTSEALKNARDVTQIVGRGIVEPNLTEGLVRGRPGPVARFDRVVRERVLRGPIVRVKLWTPSGRVVYSDDRALVGQRFELGADEVASLRNGTVDSGVSDLSLPENRSERGLGKLLEVYLPVRTPAGQPLLFEAYQHFSSISSGARDVWLAFLPALIVALLALYLVQLPLAASLARRLRRGSREREELLQRAVDASADERRRIAGDLHDGVVQDLAGLSFGLSAAAERTAAAARREWQRSCATARSRRARACAPAQTAGRDLPAQFTPGGARSGPLGPGRARRGARYRGARRHPGRAGPRARRRGAALPGSPGDGAQRRRPRGGA